MFKEHALKTEPPWFQLIWDGEKTFELRYNDRNYQEGDALTLNEYDRGANFFFGRQIMARVKRLYTQKELPGIEDGYVLMLIAVIDKSTN